MAQTLTIPRMSSLGRSLRRVELPARIALRVRAQEEASEILVGDPREASRLASLVQLEHIERVPHEG